MLFTPATFRGKQVPGFAAQVLAFADKEGAEEAALRSAALCVSDDLVEYASPGSHSIVLAGIFPHMLSCAAAENGILRHPAVYGLGLVAQHAPAFFAGHMGAALGVLSACVSAADAREEEKESSTDNAISSLIKIVRHCPAAAAHTEAIMKGALEYMPMTGDAIEGTLAFFFSAVVCLPGCARLTLTFFFPFPYSPPLQRAWWPSG